MSSHDQVCIRIGQLIQCTQCSEISTVPEDVLGAMIPMFLTCPKCNYKIHVTKKAGNQFPKLSPPLNAVSSRWIITVVNADNKETAEGEKLDSVLNGDIEWRELEGKPPKYFQLAKLLRQTMRAGLDISAQIQVQMERFARDWRNEVIRQCSYARLFERFWRVDKIEDYIKHPICSIAVDLDNPELSLRTRVVFSPKFFAVNFGIPLSDRGGMRAELVTPFTVISKSINGAFADILDIPPPPLLNVAGKKIIGSEVILYWNEIPGVINDVDATLDDPSIVIDDYRARVWLAVRGVRPWAPTHISDIIDKTDVNEHDLTFGIQEKYAMPWKKLTNYGRVGIWWQDVDMLRSFCWFAASRIRGAKLVLTCSGRDEKYWHYIRDRSKTNIPRNENSIVFESMVRGLDMKPYMSYNMIFVDVCNMPWSRMDIVTNIASVLEQLFDFNGVVVVIGNEPLLDIEFEGHVHCLAHALGGFEIYDNLDSELNPDFKPEKLRRIIQHIRKFKSKNKL